MHWDTDRLKLFINGKKKLTLSQMASKLHGDLPLLNDAVVCSVAKLAKARKMIQFHAVHLIPWYSLGRVQSEALLLTERTTGGLQGFDAASSPPSRGGYGGQGHEDPEHQVGTTKEETKWVSHCEEMHVLY